MLYTKLLMCKSYTGCWDTGSTRLRSEEEDRLTAAHRGFKPEGQAVVLFTACYDAGGGKNLNCTLVSF